MFANANTWHLHCGPAVEGLPPELAAREEETMRQQADVKCYHCGDVSGTWVWPAHASPTVGLFRAASSQQAQVVPLAKVRCRRCQGPVYLDDPEPVGVRREIVIGPGRAGRPRKQPLLAS